jgi:hypothetical protein
MARGVEWPGMDFAFEKRAIILHTPGFGPEGERGFVCALLYDIEKVL